jgi:phosphoserine phosphatase
MFATVVLDVDSTLCGIEGIDWLATRRTPEIARLVAAETNRAMRGEKRLEEVYGERLALVCPTAKDILSLSLAYSATVAPGAAESVAKWQAAGVQMIVITSGIRQAVLAVAHELGVPEASVYGVNVYFNEDGSYRAFDETSPLTTAMGKRDILSRISAARPILAAGDGITDVAMRGTADSFAAFTGFVARPAVMAQADFVVSTFGQLDEIVLGAMR